MNQVLDVKTLLHVSKPISGVEVTAQGIDTIFSILDQIYDLIGINNLIHIFLVHYFSFVLRYQQTTNRESCQHNYLWCGKSPVKIFST